MLQGHKPHRGRRGGGSGIDRSGEMRGYSNNFGGGGGVTSGDTRGGGSQYGGQPAQLNAGGQTGNNFSGGNPSNNYNAYRGGGANRYISLMISSPFWCDKGVDKDK